MDKTDISNKEFVKQYIPFSTLKKVGFFDKSVKAKDYDAIVDLFLKYFGQTKRQYIMSLPTFNLELCPGFVNGKMPSTVDKDGNLNYNGFHLTLD